MTTMMMMRTVPVVSNVPRSNLLVDWCDRLGHGLRSITITHQLHFSYLSNQRSVVITIIIWETDNCRVFLLGVYAMPENDHTQGRNLC